MIDVVTSSFPSSSSPLTNCVGMLVTSGVKSDLGEGVGVFRTTILFSFKRSHPHSDAERLNFCYDVFLLSNLYSYYLPLHFFIFSFFKVH